MTDSDEANSETSYSGILAKKMTRRRALSSAGKAAVAGGIIVVAGAATGAYFLGGGGATTTVTATQTTTATATSTTTSIPPATSLTYWGHDIALGQEAIAEFAKETNITISSTSIDFFTLAQRLISSGGLGWDVGFTGRIKQIIPSGAISPIPVSKLPRWKEGTLEPLIIHPESFLGPNYVKRFNNLMWKNVGTDLWGLTNIWNYDSVGYNPEFIPFEEKGGAGTTMSYGLLFDPQYKGKTAMQDEALTVFSETANLLNATNQLNVEDTVTNLNQQELTSVQNYLNPVFSSGQVKAFWSDFGKIVTLLSTREIHAASCWQPVTLFTREAGTPSYYAALQNGPFFWWNGDLMSSKIDPSRLDAAYQFFTFQMGPWWAANTAHNGYGVVDPFAPDIKPFMGDEFWGWFYNGEATYEPIDQIIKETWPDHPEFQNLEPRLKQALFRPSKYFPTGGAPRQGSPSSSGNLRELGSIDDKNKITRYFLSPDFPDTPDAYQEAFSTLKASIPA